MTVWPASSLQTNGIYHITRNPMYLGLAIVYLGLSCLIGNWWNIILLPFLLLLVQQYIIKNEEKYLERRFGKEYAECRHKVRRWLGVLGLKNKQQKANGFLIIRLIIVNGSQLMQADVSSVASFSLFF